MRNPAPKALWYILPHTCPNPLRQRAGNAGSDTGGSKPLLPVGTVTTTIMQIRVVNSRAEIATVDPEERVVYLATHPVALALLELIKRCPHLEAVELSPSRYRNMCKSSWGLLEAHGVKIFEGTVQRRRTDRTGYFTVDERAIRQRAEELRARGLDSGEFVAKAAEEAGVSAGPVGFILGR